MQQKINCHSDLINYTYTFKMYNGHCINPHRSFKTKSPSKVFTHVHLNQAALYKARHEFQYRCWASNENFNAPAYSVCLRGLLSCPVITLSFPILTLMKWIWITPIKSSNNHRWFQGLQSEGWAEPPTPQKKQKIDRPWAGRDVRRVMGSKKPNMASCDTNIYSTTGLEGGIELPLPALRS